MDHTWRDCPAWTMEREVLMAEVGADIALTSVVPRMVRNPNIWRAVATFASEIMTAKEAAERAREREESGEDEGAYSIQVQVMLE